MSKYSNDDVVIVDGYRTPVGKYKKAFATLRAHDLSAILIKKLLEICHLKAEDVSEVIIGQVLTAGQGQNPARQASVKGGLPYTIPASGISFLCGSGLKAVANAYQAILVGDSSVVLAGGQESMSNAPLCVDVLRDAKLEDCPHVNSMVYDGLTDAFYGYHMGMTAENVAKQWNISRKEQDEFAMMSQQKIADAKASGFFAEEIVSVSVHTHGEDVSEIQEDEFPTPSTTLEGLSKLKPAFIKDGTGTVTAGNASGINDAAAIVLVSSMSEVRRLKLKEPLARIVSWAQVGNEPSIMGTAPIEAVRKAVDKAGWSLNEVDLFELNEAFAAQSIVVIRELDIPFEKVNVCGGSIGIGHPIGASGARILVTLLHSMRRLKKRKGVASLCIGGGMGIAMCLERL